MRAGDSAAFWTFSLDVYGRPGVREACLALQDEAGLDVNLLLYCLWRAARGVELDGDEIRARMDAVAPWTGAAVAPLRRLRRSLKNPEAGVPAAAATEIAARIGEVELAAERVAQSLIVESVPEPAAATRRDPDEGEIRGLAEVHLRRYSALSGAEAGRAEWTILSGAISPGL